MVFGRLFKKSAPARTAALPAGERVYAIGDIHGRADLFDQLLAQVRVDDAARGAARTTIILLGDLVDRGPDSRGVIERAMTLRAEYRQS
jgi:serine/threonine protein phosphatase 1